eukprot:CAMPEP_0113678766 /NCGR_PEP_ID=MMETSP0038_2-20120614/10164_1 /TAXON_ID=2898 /ORGANISM="Cryptomonas paramecium" /LENGTH=203 /DNA_ID=CAMNT_0000596509 /DNA_START=34 /DNA_END=642 /DNA_ORIENTATION=+ /assembly_acc=CAM_ASM_000170
MAVPVEPMVNNGDEFVLFTDASSPAAFGLLSRENSGTLFLSRENSGVMVKLPQAMVVCGALSRSDSLTFADFSSEDSAACVSCKRESSVGIDFLLNSDELFDLLGQLTPKAEPVECGGELPMHVDAQEEDCEISFKWPTSHSQVEDEEEAANRSLAGEPSPSPRQRPQKRASQRGAHVRGRPEMQRTAREGAVHWSRKVRDVR